VTNCVPNLALGVAEQSMLFGGSLENHSKASLLKKDEKTRHQMGLLIV